MSDEAKPRASGVAQAALVIEFKGSDRFPGPFLSAQSNLEGIGGDRRHGVFP